MWLRGFEPVLLPLPGRRIPRPPLPAGDKSRSPEVRQLLHPELRAFPGGTVPAAVVSIGKNLIAVLAASSAAWYPATVACDERASMPCALVIRGTSSKARAVVACRGQLPHLVGPFQRFEEANDHAAAG